MAGQQRGLQDVALGTHGGVRSCRVVEAADPLYLIESEMGVPRVMQRTIELPGVGNVAGAMVNVGNPHFVLFVDTDDFGAHGHSWQEIGERISTSPLFPHGTNVEFVQVMSETEIAFRIYERGCGPTTSSGTGTCASSAAAMALRGVGAGAYSQCGRWIRSGRFGLRAEAVMRLDGTGRDYLPGRGCWAVRALAEACGSACWRYAGGAVAGEYA